MINRKIKRRRDWFKKRRKKSQNKFESKVNCVPLSNANYVFKLKKRVRLKVAVSN